MHFVVKNLWHALYDVNGFPNEVHKFLMDLNGDNVYYELEPFDYMM
jgi:hypothetical protein